MYFIDRQKIELTLQHMEKQLSLFKQSSSWESPFEKAALERISMTIIEAILDVGNAMIDGFIMRDPGSFDDIIDILEDEKVVTAEIANGLKQVIRQRKMLVQQYINVNHEAIIAVFHAQFSLLAAYPSKIRYYLTNELGPVSAFKSEGGNKQ